MASRRSQTPILEYRTQPNGTQPTRAANVAWQSILAASGFFFIPPFMCTCGHLGRDALVATAPMLLFAWWGFVERLSPIGRLIAGIVVVLATWVFAKNVIDIGWVGHNPLFRK